MSVNIPRTFTFSDGFNYSTSNIESELSNIVNTINNANAGLLTWDNVIAASATLTSITATSATLTAVNTGALTDTGLTASTALTANASKLLTSSTCTDTELAFVHGVTSAIQTQINTKAATDLSNITAPSAVTGQALTGLSAAAGSVTASSTILGAFNSILNARIVQIQSATFASSTSTASSTFANTITTVSITPKSASNNVFVLAFGSVQCATAAKTMYYTIKRGTTNLGGATSGMGATAFSASSASSSATVTIAVYDSPAATTSTTYTVAIASADNSTSVLWGPGNVWSAIFAIEIGVGN